MFRKLEVSDFVKAGIQTIPIIRQGTRIIKNYLLGKTGVNTQDLVLLNIVVVEGFYINIVLEALLLKAGLWFSRINCLLR